jgi:tRNA(Arg) A34 adenosine deaminase TadA
MSASRRCPELRIAVPGWIDDVLEWERAYGTPAERMGVALECARQNVLRGSGGPFGAAVFEAGPGTLVAVGVNLVAPLNNSCLHAEVVALMMAEAVLGTYVLHGGDLPVYELYASCEPCAMCLGAAHWSGVRNVVWSALRDDARRLGFDEGPVFPESYDYLRDRGMDFTGGVLLDEGRAVLDLYRQSGGIIYNPPV